MNFQQWFKISADLLILQPKKYGQNMDLNQVSSTLSGISIQLYEVVQFAAFSQ